MKPPEIEIPKVTKVNRIKESASFSQGKKGRRDHITGNLRINIPVSEAKKFRGVMREDRKWWLRGDEWWFGNYPKDRWVKFLNDIARNGMEHMIFITVDPGQKPEINEGNHRIQAALQLGLKTIPAEIRFFGKSEDEVTGFIGDAVEKFKEK